MEKLASPSQIALAWLLAQKDYIVPIPGTKKIRRIEENIGCLHVAFTDEELEDIRKKPDSISILGGRYPAAHQRLVKG